MLEDEEGRVGEREGGRGAGWGRGGGRELEDDACAAIVVWWQVRQEIKEYALNVMRK